MLRDGRASQHGVRIAAAHSKLSSGCLLVQVVFLSNLPLIDATFQVAEEQPRQQQFFMLDSGAGGVDCIFHGRAVEELSLLKSSTSSKSLRVSMCCQEC